MTGLLSSIGLATASGALYNPGMANQPALCIFRNRVWGCLAALCASTGAWALDEFKYRADMYDLDQRRTALPNDGRMYCVPASFANLCAYLNKYGMNDMTAGFNRNSHSEMSSFLLTLGILFGTHPTEGTKNSKPAETAWISSKTNKLVFFGSYGPSSSWGYRTIMNQFRAGALVRMAYGRYKLVGGEWSRKGGHSVTLAGHQRYDSGSAPNLFFVADPAADDGDWGAQGSFVFQIKETSNISLTTEDHGLVTHARYTNWVGENGDRRAVVDSMLAVLPVYAGWPAVEGDMTTFRIKVPWQMNPSATYSDFPTEVEFTTTDSIVDWTFDQADFGVVYVTSTGNVKRYDIASGTTTVLMSSAAARMVAIGGPDMDVYVLREGAFFDSITKVARRNGGLKSRNLNTKVAGIDIDDTSGGIVALHSSLSAVTEFDMNFATSKTTRLVSLSLTDGAPISVGGVPVFTIDQETGDYFVSREGNNYWDRYPKSYGVRKGYRVTYNGPTLQRLVSGPQGVMFVQDLRGVIRTLTRAGHLVGTDFSGIQATGPFRLSRSFTMHRPGEMLGPGWYNELPVGDEP